MPDRFKIPPSGLDRQAFIALYGGVYEHSPWFADTAWRCAAKGSLDGLEGLAGALKDAVDDSDRQTQMDLIRAHPDLGGRLGTLTAASRAEQAGAGLDACTPEEFAEFHRLNDAYKAKFGFPFIKAVRGFSRAEILEEFRRRLTHDPDTEFATALGEIHKIARLRLKDLT